MAWNQALEPYTGARAGQYTRPGMTLYYPSWYYPGSTTLGTPASAGHATAAGHAPAAELKVLWAQ